MRENFGSGAPWEEAVGYSRVVTVDSSAWVAGTTATVDGEVVGVGDAYRQSKVAFGIAVDALRAAGFDIADVVRTRMFITEIADFDEVGRAHSELFDAVRPVSTMLQVAGLAHPDHLVEVEIDAQRATS